MDTAEILVLLLASVAALALLAQRLTILYPILLVLGGLAIGFVPGLPSVRLSPELVLLIFLPPLLFAQAWMTPWREFWKYRRPIFLLAVGLVLFTTTAVAFAAKTLMGLPLTVGFVLGAIVSPPDAVAASAIAERFGLPRRVVRILEGESLVNDATGLVAYKFALAAVLTGTFSFAQAGLQFVFVAVGGIALGWAVGWGSARIFERVKDESVLITLITPRSLRELLDRGAIGSFRRPGSGHLRSLPWAARAADAQRLDTARGGRILGHVGFSAEQRRVSADWSAASDDLDQPVQLFGADAFVVCHCHMAGRDPGASYLGFSRCLFAALAQPSHPPDRARPWVAQRAHRGVERHARSGFARRRAGAARNDRQRRTVSRPRPAGVPDVCGDTGNSGWPGVDPGAIDQMAGSPAGSARRKGGDQDTHCAGGGGAVPHCSVQTSDESLGYFLSPSGLAETNDASGFFATGRLAHRPTPSTERRAIARSFPRYRLPPNLETRYAIVRDGNALRFRFTPSAVRQIFAVIEAKKSHRDDRK